MDLTTTRTTAGGRVDLCVGANSSANCPASLQFLATCRALPSMIPYRTRELQWVLMCTEIAHSFIHSGCKTLCSRETPQPVSG